MCGIAGILDYRTPISSQEIDRFVDSLTHRGPDGRGVYLNNAGSVNVALGHRRLAILDLSSQGKNPMPYGGEDGQRYWITYNGEVYNFIEIRSELQSLGYRFQSETDTEVIIAAYEQWGLNCLERFNGMWAFAVWDTIDHSLLLVRDRFGIKPLYYWASGSKFAFASEIKAFLKLDKFEPKINDQVGYLLTQNCYAYEGVTDQTLIQSLRRLKSGHYLKLTQDGTLTVSQWWETRDHFPNTANTYEKQVEEFRDLFLDSVRLRMRSDVPLGTCLSGGVDSSAVASSMAWLNQKQNSKLERCPQDWQQTFIAEFPNTFLDEREYADEVVRHTGTKPRYWKFDDREALNHLLDSVWSMEEVYGAIAVPIWSTYRLMRQSNVRVSLDGHGGDELLGGYTWYLDWPVSQVNENLYRDFHTTLLPSILRNYDRCSMAHGIEVRMPLMDWRLVTYSFGLPAQAKMGGGFTKRIFRDAMAGIMPKKNRLRRSKIGFNSPMVEWFNGGMSKFLTWIVNHPLWLESPYWNGLSLRDTILRKTVSQTWNQSDWGLCLDTWIKINIVLFKLMFIEFETPESIQKQYN
ncbi:MAG: asparagine synthase (glutamine-hydrolyzing) [Limnothrix sp. RL_2_0]|nr:asparagine synthase (glutamine-hydrolyzing) [Limnothrix sp. RL_2_0]